jgi:tetratricopeptide (TPR) repeat protein
MLFDLRGRGRRRTVQVIYVGLALLMAAGLIGFGIGGATSGGLLDAIKSGNGNGSSSDVFKKQVQRAETRARTSPKDPKAWTELARVRYQEAVGAGLNESTGEFNDTGKRAMAAADAAWQRALKLTDKPDPNVATTMVQLYIATQQYDKAVQAFEIQLAATPDPTWQLYAKWAQLAYLAKQDRKAELAGKKAIRVAPKDDREQAKAAIQSAKDQAAQAAQQATQQGGSGATTTVPATVGG